MRGPVLAVLALAVLLPTLALAAGAPSFDCRKAGTDAEKAICGNKALAKADTAIAVAYDRLRRALDPHAAEVLAADQRLFVGARDDAGPGDEGGGAFRSLEQRLSERLAFLKGVKARPAAGYPGSWRNVMGGLDIVAKTDGGFTVSGTVVEPVSGRWVCEVAGEGRISGDGLEVRQEGETSFLRLTRQGAGLKAETVFADGTGEKRVGYCGQNGSVDGSYLQVSPARQ